MLRYNDVNDLLKVGVDSKLGNTPIVTIMGMKRTTSNFLPVSHDGEGNETYIDKIENLLGENDGVRAEFISRKQEGIERRAHMNIIRREIHEIVKKDKYKDTKKVIKFIKEKDYNKKWNALFNNECIIPHKLCIACPNCSLFGGWNSGNNNKTFSRARSFDTYSIQKDDSCIINDESVAGMKIGNQVKEDATSADSSNFHYYETVKPGVYFPFIVMIERATLLDVASYLKAIRWADNHGYGKYSARNGKFQSEIWAVANGHPKFSVLDILESAEDIDAIRYDNFKELLEFEGEVLLKSNENSIGELENKFAEEFEKYFDLLVE